MNGLRSFEQAGRLARILIAQIAGKDARYADVRADQLMKMPGVRERIEELKAEASAKCSLSREAYMRAS